MTNYNKMANKAANDYVNAVTLAYALKGVGNSRQIEALVNAISCMYQNQTQLINDIVMPEEENYAQIEIPDFLM